MEERNKGTLGDDFAIQFLTYYYVIFQIFIFFSLFLLLLSSLFLFASVSVVHVLLILVPIEPVL